MSKSYTHKRLTIRTDDGGSGDLTGYTHKGCGGEIVYNGNYFCEHWRECGGVSTSLSYNERKGEWGPPSLAAQEKELVAGLAANRRGEYRDLGEMELL